MEKVGIENLKLIIALPVEIGNISMSIAKSEDKTWKKWLNIFGLIDEIADLFKIKDWSSIKTEYMDLDQLERAEVNQYMCEKFDIADDRIEVIVEKGFCIIFNLEAVVKDSIDLVKQIKA